MNIGWNFKANNFQVYFKILDFWKVDTEFYLNSLILYDMLHIP